MGIKKRGLARDAEQDAPDAEGLFEDVHDEGMAGTVAADGGMEPHPGHRADRHGVEPGRAGHEGVGGVGVVHGEDELHRPRPHRHEDGERALVGDEDGRELAGGDEVLPPVGDEDVVVAAGFVIVECRVIH